MYRENLSVGKVKCQERVIGLSKMYVRSDEACRSPFLVLPAESCASGYERTQVALCARWSEQAAPLLRWPFRIYTEGKRLAWALLSDLNEFTVNLRCGQSSRLSAQVSV